MEIELRAGSALQSDAFAMIVKSSRNCGSKISVDKVHTQFKRFSEFLMYVSISKAIDAYLIPESQSELTNFECRFVLSFKHFGCEIGISQRNHKGKHNLVLESAHGTHASLMTQRLKDGINRV